MRIVSGRWRGRVIRAPSDPRVRPTADRVREAWMSIVQPFLPGATVLDLFAGSGALGLEALSRGAEHADFVELDPRSLRTVKDNAARLGATDAVHLHRADAIRFLASLDPLAYDVAFADPPYGVDFGARVAAAWQSVPFARVLGIEHAARETMPAGGDTRRYGDTAVTFYRLESED